MTKQLIFKNTSFQSENVFPHNGFSEQVKKKDARVYIIIIVGWNFDDEHEYKNLVFFCNNKSLRLQDAT